MSLDLIIQPFANQGDKASLPQNSATGFVNFLDGYTKDYEISLAAGNPQAKAVERQVQNYLFNQANEHAMQWMQRTLPPWFSAMVIGGVAGYKKNSMVLRQQPGGDWWPYRSLVDANVSDPLTTPAQWEYTRTEAESLALVPMPAGAGSKAAEVITSAVDFNTLTASGTYEVINDTVFGSCTNTPNMDGTYSGVLEVKSWQDTTPATRVIQRYTSSFSRVYTRYALAGTWSAWVAYTSVTEIRNRRWSWVPATFASNTYTLAPNPALTSRADGMRLQFDAISSNTGATSINDGIGTTALVGMGGAPLVGGEIVAGRNSEIMWDANLSGGVWVLIGCNSASQQIPGNSYLTSRPAQFDNSTKVVDSGFVQRALGSFSGETIVTSTGSITAAAAGGLVIGNSASATTQTLPAANSVAAGTVIEFLNINTGAMTVQRAGSDTIFGNGLSTSLTMNQYETLMLESSGGTAWRVVGGSISNYTAPQFDVGGRAANTAFVQRALGNMQSAIATASAVTLTAADTGKAYSLNAGSSIVMPLFSTVPAGASFMIINADATNKTITRQGSDLMFGPSGQGAALLSTVTSFTLRPGDWCIMSAQNSQWEMFAGSPLLGVDTGPFGVSKSATGYQKLPSGLIMQWGTLNVTIATANVLVNNTVTWPITFPNACLTAHATMSNCPVAYFNLSAESLGQVNMNLVASAGQTGTNSVHWFAIGW